MGEHFKKELLDIGVSGFKIDEVDGYDQWVWPDNASFPSGLDGETMRQIYGTLVQKWSHELYKEKNERTYGLVRASNAGASSFPYVIYNDYYRHEDFITALINSSFCGVLWTPEVRKSGTPEEWLRRMQTVCFSPMAMINAWADGTKPWSFPEVYEQCQDVAFLRMQLLPYIYTTFANYFSTIIWTKTNLNQFNHHIMFSFSSQFHLSYIGIYFLNIFPWNNLFIKCIEILAFFYNSNHPELISKRPSTSLPWLPYLFFTSYITFPFLLIWLFPKDQSRRRSGS